MLVDYHIHAAAHGEYQYTYEWLNCFVEKALSQGINEIGFSEHDEYLDRIKPELIQQINQQHRGINVRLGLEIDFIPGRNEEIRRLISAYDFDYILGSVHFISGWGFDHPDERHFFEQKDIDEVYRDYFDLVAGAAQSRLFDVMSHLDLVKVWGHRPRSPVSNIVEPVLQGIKQEGLVIEINSSGLRKPVAEIYPAFSIIERMAAMGIAVTMGSDAHHPDQVGYELAETAQLLKRAGYRKMIKFISRQKVQVDL
jgi:histidinol-phosphatase (PHP family)